MRPIFNNHQLRLSEVILENNAVFSLENIYASEVKNLAVSWSFYSGKIEGNTYTLVETETLLKDGITSPKRYEDAKMLKNLYNTFITEFEYIKKGNKEIIDEKLLFRIHSSIADGLISDEDKGKIRTRPVLISGTSYRPLKDSWEIKQRLSEIFYEQDTFENPLEKAVFLHCNLARLQPFIDANKRTARCIESIALLNEGILPVYSTEEAGILQYRKGLIHFYESQDYSLYADYFLQQKLELLQDMTSTDLKKRVKLHL